MIATLKDTPVVPLSIAAGLAPRFERSEYLPITGRHPREVTPHLQPPASSLQSPASRRGVSLLEVLIAVFVLTFGLLSVAMVIPAGRALMVEASKSDRSAACGRAALDDVRIREWHRPSRWRQQWGSLTGYRSAIVNSGQYSNLTAIDSHLIYNVGGSANPTSRGLIYGETYFVDPFFMVYADNETRTSVRHFPYSAYPGREIVWHQADDPRQSPDRALARRVSLGFSEALAERLTTWADELIFHLEGDSVRPRQIFTTTDGQAWAFPAIPGDGKPATANPLRSTDMGRFTWAAMVTPLVPVDHDAFWDHDDNADTPGIPLVNPDRISKYEIAIIVFYNRSLYCPIAGGDDDQLQTITDLEIVRERSVYAQIVGDGIGGGDVFLFVDNEDARPAGYLDVRKNDWIMLKGPDLDRAVRTTVPPNDPPGPPDPTALWYTMPNVCKWYRVVAVDEVLTANPDDSAITIIDPDSHTVDGSIELEGRGRYVTLAGPDWQVNTTYNLTTGNTPPFDPETDIAEAALIDDVVGVYTTVIDATTH